MSTAPEAAAVGPNVPSVKQRFLNCWSCRIVSGGGLVLSGAYVYNAARKVMRKGVISAGIVGQISFAAGLAAWGVVVIADPVGKMKKA